jgi:hypothetical protein
MLVKSLDGYESKWMLNTSAQTKKSGPHLAVLDFLKKTYPTVQILEEVQIKVKKNKELYLDFYIPLYNIAIEIDGQHHRTFVPFFSKNKRGFIKQQTNDKLKESWCELNNISFVRLDDNEKEEEWQQKLI